MLCATETKWMNFIIAFWILVFACTMAAFKMLAMDAKNAENQTRSELFLDR